MKKPGRIILTLVIISALAISFSACSKTAENTQSKPAKTTEEYVDSEEFEPDNPVVKYVGKYDNGEYYITVEAMDDNEAKFTVDRPMTERTSEGFVFSGTFDKETLSVNYSDSTKSLFDYDTDGTVSDEEIEYKNGSGKIIFHDDSTLEWIDENEAENLSGNTIFKPAADKNE